jgi:hypothetical protein
MINKNSTKKLNNFFVVKSKRKIILNFNKNRFDREKKVVEKIANNRSKTIGDRG